MPQSTPAPPVANVRTNVLHGYSNYTYNLQLWALTIDSFNQIANGKITVGQESNLLSGAELLISNAGQNPKGGDTRSPSFPTDFVIDNLEIDTVVGNQGPGKGADALQMTFDIIEPYTVTLLNRLSDVVLRKGLGKDYKTLVYCMKIQFFGYDDSGKPVNIPTSTKYIPFGILSMKFSITHKGAVYSCKCIAKKNLVMTMIDNNIPFHIELKGGTVGEFFNAVSSSVMTAAEVQARSDTAGANVKITKPSDTKGLAAALNKNELDRVEISKTQNINNEYYFQFDDELLNATVSDPAKLVDDAKSFPTLSGTSGFQNIKDGRVGVLTLDPTHQAFKAQAGTKITALIDSICSITDFAKNQVKNTPDVNTPIRLWKIFPKLQIKAYDNKLNNFGRVITYVVNIYDYYGEAHPNLGQKPPPQASIVKVYDYLYTGLNKDVVKASLDFQFAFFENFNAAKTGYVDGANNSTGQNSNNVSETQDNIVDSSFYKALRNPTQGIASEQNSVSNTVDDRSIAVGEIISKYLDNRADMIQLDLEIVGDPDWIQQDNILYDVNTLKKGEKTLTNGTITYHDSQTVFQFNFKSPTKDYDDTTGLLVTTGASTANFSGLYRVMKVKSMFKHGRFTQKLENARVRIQDTKQITTVGAAPGAAPVDAQPITTATPTLPTIGQNELNADGLFNGITGATQTPTFMTGA